MSKEKLKGNLLPAILHPNIPKNAKWLSGQGEGTWFVISKEEVLSEQEYRIRRFSPQGNLECDRAFKLEQIGFKINEEFEIAHISHCALVRIKQQDIIYKLVFTKEFE